MKKLVLGCLGVLVVVTIAGGIAGYVFVYKPAKSYVTSLTQFQDFPKLNADIRNQESFSAPESGELTAELVDRYVSAQTAIEAALGPRLKQLDEKYKALERANGGKPGFSDGLAALKDLGTLMMDAKRAQVAALNAQHFSLEEYEWVRVQMYAAAGIPLQGNFAEVIEQAGRGEAAAGETASMAGELARAVPEINRQLVAPHLQQLRDRAALAFFGL